jgi:hypothetical protein
MSHSSPQIDWYREAFLEFLDRVLDTCFIPSRFKTLIKSAAKMQIGPYLSGDDDLEQES